MIKDNLEEKCIHYEMLFIEIVADGRGEKYSNKLQCLNCHDQLIDINEDYRLNIYPYYIKRKK